MRFFFLVAACVVLTIVPARVLAVSCAGGTLDITAASDTPVTLPTFNVGQMVKLTAATSGITLTSLTWSIDGPLIKDYNERIGETPGGALPWSTNAPTTADLSTSPITFYWKPSVSQIAPLNGGPVTRNVTLIGQVGSTACTVAATYNVERNTTDPRKQANDYFTSNHAAPTETVAGKGIVIDDHIDWHEIPGTHLFGDAQDFFRWHRELINRVNLWHAEFGYAPVLPWYPGTPYPPGTDDIQYAARNPAYSTDGGQLYRPFTIAGGASDPSVGVIPQLRLVDFTDANALDAQFEFGYHGDVHCAIGNQPPPIGAQTFNDPLGGPETFGDMCNFSSPKDPIFYPWHSFVDTVYGNLCVLRSLTCAGTPRPATDAWMADNAADIAANGNTPSPPIHYISPDIWNRNAPATCTPPDAGSGVLRSCGSAADHENPVAGTTNYLYATLRNDRPGATTAVYTEVAVYVAAAATGLAWPADFGGAPAGIPLLESRHFITIALAPGQQTDIGPLPWTPPNPVPSDHWCAYIRVLNVQEAPAPVEGANIDTNTANNNAIAWRNLKIVLTPGPKPPHWIFPGFNLMGAFIVRNLGKQGDPVDLVIRVPHAVAKPGTVRLALGTELYTRYLRSGAKLRGFADVRPDAVRQQRYVPLRMLGDTAVISGIVLEPHTPFAAAVDAATQKLGRGAIIVEQRSHGRVDGGVVLQVGRARFVPGTQK